MESKLHSDLVQKIVHYVRDDKFKEFFPENGQILDITEKELFNEISFSAISRGDYIGQDIQKSIYIIGEAKTEEYSLDEASSKLQLRNYLKIGIRKINFHLIYAVPLSIFRSTKAQLLHEIRNTKKCSLTLHVLTDTRHHEVKKI